MVVTALLSCRWPFSLMASFSEETDPQKLMQRATVYLIHQAFLHWQNYAAMEIVSDKKADFTCNHKIEILHLSFPFVSKVCVQAKWSIMPELIGFCSMKWLGVILHPSGWVASESQGYPQH